jgi:pilus assembly protein CpaC
MIFLDNCSIPYISECDGLLENLFESSSLENFQSVLLTYTLNSLFPLLNVKVTSTPKGYIVEGKVPDPQMATKIMEIIVKLVPRGEKAVINLMDIEPQLVLVKVRVYEVKKDFLSRVGLNWKVLFDNTNQSLAVAAVYPRVPLDFPNYFMNAMGQFGNYNLSILLDMLEEEGLSKIIAEPNLTTVSGEKANFFVGGEYPIPVPQGGAFGGGFTAAVTIEYKKYGVILDCTPFVDLNGLITLHVVPEVSNLDYSNAVVLQGFVIPGLLTRRVNTIVKLWSGQSYIIGGLLLRTPSNKNDSLYGLNKIPLIGCLFNSNRYEQHQTELVIIVTPILINENRLNAYQGKLPLECPPNEYNQCDIPSCDDAACECPVDETAENCGCPIDQPGSYYNAADYGGCGYGAVDGNTSEFIETTWESMTECPYRNYYDNNP